MNTPQDPLNETQKDGLFDAVSVSRTFSNLREAYGLNTKRVLDIGCGHGQYLRHFGPKSIGITTASSEVEWGKRVSLDIRFGNAERLDYEALDGRFDVVWANNLFEHLLAPHAFLMNLKRTVSDDGLLVLGVPVFPALSGLTRFARFRGVFASNHINFFTQKTLRITVERAGWQVVDARSFFFSNRLLDCLLHPIAPHIYIVAKNNHLFVYPPKKEHEWVEDEHYAAMLKITGQKR